MVVKSLFERFVITKAAIKTFGCFEMASRHVAPEFGRGKVVGGMIVIISCLFTSLFVIIFVVVVAMLTQELFLLSMVFQMRFEFQFCFKMLRTKVALVMILLLTIVIGANEFIIQHEIKMDSI